MPGTGCRGPNPAKLLVLRPFSALVNGWKDKNLKPNLPFAYYRLDAVNPRTKSENFPRSLVLSV
jgi:hypothetical protein